MKFANIKVLKSKCGSFFLLKTKQTSLKTESFYYILVHRLNNFLCWPHLLTLRHNEMISGHIEILFPCRRTSSYGTGNLQAQNLVEFFCITEFRNRWFTKQALENHQSQLSRSLWYPRWTYNIQKLYLPGKQIGGQMEDLFHILLVMHLANSC